MQDFLKDLLYTIIEYLTRNEAFRKTIATNTRVLGGSPALVRFIVALSQQCKLKQRSYYKRIRTGSVKGVWYGSDASYKSEVQLTSGSGPIVLYIHGGAFVSGQAKMWSDFNAKVIEEHKKKFSKDLRIFSVDYTNAPDQSYPCQWTECQAALDYLTRTMGVDPARLFISGDSAGGNLALLTLFEMENAKSLAGAVLFSPWVLPGAALVMAGKVKDPNDIKPVATDSWYVNEKNDYVTAKFGQQGIVEYIGKSMTYETAYSSKQINPLLRSDDEYKALPDLLIAYGEGERLKDQITEFIKKAKASTASVEVFSVENGVHDWPLSSKFTPDIAQYHRGIETVSAWIEKKMIHTSLPLEKY